MDGVDQDRLDALKIIAGPGDLDERCRRLMPYIVTLFDLHLGPAVTTVEERRRRRLAAAARRQAMIDHAAWKAERDRVRVAA